MGPDWDAWDQLGEAAATILDRLRREAGCARSYALLDPSPHLDDPVDYPAELPSELAGEVVKAEFALRLFPLRRDAPQTWYYFIVAAAALASLQKTLPAHTPSEGGVTVSYPERLVYVMIADARTVQKAVRMFNAFPPWRIP